MHEFCVGNYRRRGDLASVASPMDAKLILSAAAGVAVGVLSLFAANKFKRTILTTGATKFYNPAQIYAGVVYTSGQIAVAGKDPTSGKPILSTGGITPESKQALANLKSVLEASGSSIDKVLKVTAYLTDMSDYAAFNDVYLTFFSDDATRPARVCIAVKQLPFNALVEVEATAIQ